MINLWACSCGLGKAKKKKKFQRNVWEYKPQIKQSRVIENMKILHKQVIYIARVCKWDKKKMIWEVKLDCLLQNLLGSSSIPVPHFLSGVLIKLLMSAKGKTEGIGCKKRIMI